jgi:CubicO group peptidase (beta-lactamase class C family)
MFTVCAAIVEEASGVRFIDFVREHILQPLAMNDTTYEPLQDAPEKLATGQYIGPDCKAPIGMAYHLDAKACNMFAGCAGLTSTPRELAVWTNWFISTHRAGQLAEALPAPQLLTKDSFDRIMQPLSIVEPGMFSGDNFSEVSTPLYSLGVYHTTYRGCRLRFHLGEDPGFQCVIGWLPDLGKGFSILSTSFPVADRL